MFYERGLVMRKSGVFAHLVGNITNVVVVGTLLAFFVGTDVQNEPELTIEEVLAESVVEPEKDYHFPDPATLSFIEDASVAITPDILELAKGIYFEARSENYEGQVRVARAILRRVDDPRWPNSIEAVLRQGEERRNRCQFSYMCDGKPEHIKNKAVWKQALAVAKEVYREWQEGSDVGCAHSYHASYVTSKPALAWFATLEQDTQVGTHIFYCDKQKNA